MIRMASVEQALQLIDEHGRACAMPVEAAPVGEASGRRLAEDVIARVSQPPADVSAMDGYAVIFADMRVGATLTVSGESRAGLPAGQTLARGEAIRIFTGAHVPPGADHILIQEDARREGDAITLTAVQHQPGNIRRAGLDFTQGETLVPAGRVMTPGAISLAAAGNVATVVVRKAPRIGVLANGDELAPAGSSLSPGQIVNSIQPAMMALISSWGADPIDLGISRDDLEDVRKRLAHPCDVIVSIGGASVGDYDVVRDAFAAERFEPLLEKVAVKPGKPTWFSRQGKRLALGLPGNPAAAMVTAQLFLRVLIDALTCAPPAPRIVQRASSTQALPAVGNREEYLRAILSIGADGRASVAPAGNQDSSLLSPFLTANALIRRAPGAPAATAGDLVDVIALG